MLLSQTTVPYFGLFKRGLVTHLYLFRIRFRIRNVYFSFGSDPKFQVLTDPDQFRIIRIPIRITGCRPFLFWKLSVAISQIDRLFLEP